MNKKNGKFKLLAPLLAVALSVGGFIGIEAASSAVVAASTPKVDVVSGATTVKATNPVIQKKIPVQTPAKIIVEKKAKVVSPTTTVTAVAPKVDVVSVTEQIQRVIIGEEKARKIALGLVNGEIIKLKLDHEDYDHEDYDNDEDYDDEDYDDEDYDNEKSYEIEILKNNIKYEIEIDAYTGLVLEFEIEDDDHDNNLDKITDDKDDIDDDSNEDMYQDDDDDDDYDDDDDDHDDDDDEDDGDDD